MHFRVFAFFHIIRMLHHGALRCRFRNCDSAFCSRDIMSFIAMHRSFGACERATSGSLLFLLFGALVSLRTNIRLRALSAARRENISAV